MAPPVDSLFDRFVALGDSLSMGVQNVGVSRRSQVHSVPALLARQAGAEFRLPLIAEPGYPPHVDQVGVALWGQFTKTSLAGGFRLDPTVEPDNFAVAGARLTDVIGLSCANMDRLERTTAVRHLLRQTLNPLHRPEWEALTQLDRAVAAEPTLVMVWVGGNDVLEPFFYERFRITPPSVFRTAWRRLLERLLADTSAVVLVVTVPDVTVAPLFDPWRRRARLQRLLRATVDDYNSVIRASAAASQRVVLVDLDPAMRRVAREGYDVRGWRLPYKVARGYLDFRPLFGLPGLLLSGGLITFDGLHPTNTGYALLTNVVIDALANQLGVRLPPLEIEAVAADDLLLRRVAPYCTPLMRGYLGLSYTPTIVARERQTWPIELANGRAGRP